MIALLDDEGRIQQTNLAFNKQFGTKPDELFDVPLSELVIEGFKEKLLATNITDGNRRQLVTVEVQMRGKNNRMFDAEITFAPIYSRVTDTLEVVVSIQDITRHKEEQTRLAALLESERELSELQSRFILTVTHEFRTPLTVIHSSMEILRDYYERLTEEKRTKHFRQIGDEVRHMEELLDDVLQVGQSQQDKIPFNPEPLDLVHIATQIVKQLNALQQKPDIQFTSNVAAAPFVGDMKLAVHIIRNLLTNAVKYAPDSDIVEIQLNEVDNSYEITVKDSGVGIPADEIDNLFQPFFRASNATAFQGNGLGLSIIVDAVTRHGGTVSVESAEGKGTTFSVRLPHNQSR